MPSHRLEGWTTGLPDPSRLPAPRRACLQAGGSPAHEAALRGDVEWIMAIAVEDTKRGCPGQSFKAVSACGRALRGARQ